MILRERIAALPADRQLILSPPVTLTREAILSAHPRPDLAGARVALSIADPATALPLLTALDGTADRILLLSPTIEPDLAAELAAEGGCDAILADDPARFPASEALPVHAGLDDLAQAVGGRRAAPSESRWVMTTSGTTGKPKLVGHSLASLCRSSRTDAARGRDQRWGMLYDYTRFAGLQVLLQSVLSGAKLVVPDQAAPLEDKLALFAQAGCTHLSGTPTLWRKIAMTPGAGKLPLQQATLGGEIADDRILKAVAATYPGARVSHIFASTEAGVGFSVTDGRAGFPESYLTDPPAGIGLRIEDGQLHVQNRQVIPEYLGTGTAFAQDDGWVATGDAVERREGRVFFLGRANGVINVGGDKVHPEEVERVLMVHPSVAMARVYSKANPITGALVVADIALAGDGTADTKALRESLRSHAAARLERHKVPAMFKIVPGFEMNAAGKLIRKPT